MDANLDKFVRLKKKVEEKQQEADKAEGAFNQILKQLKTEFGCSCLEEAEGKLRRLEKQEKTDKKEFDNATNTFEETWKDGLNQN